MRELRVHDPATAEQHSLEDKGFLATDDWHEIVWEIELDRMRVVVDGDVRFDGKGDYSGIESAPSVGPRFDSTVSVRELTIHAAALTTLSCLRSGTQLRQCAARRADPRSGLNCRSES